MPELSRVAKVIIFKSAAFLPGQCIRDLKSDIVSRLFIFSTHISQTNDQEFHELTFIDIFGWCFKILF